MQSLAIWTAVLVALALVAFALDRAAATRLRAELKRRGVAPTQVQRRWLRRPLVSGLSPFAQIYKVTYTRPPDTRPRVRLHAFDPLRYGLQAACRQLSGGVWRDL